MPDCFYCTGCGRYMEDDFCDSCRGEDELEACTQTPEHEASLLQLGNEELIEELT